MQIFLIIVAAIVVGLPLALLLAVIVLKWYVGRKLKGLGGSLEKAFEQLAAMAGSSLPGMRLELKPAEQTPWHNPAEIAEAVDLLGAKGFVEVDRYLVDGSNAIILGLYHHPGDHVAAALYDMKDTPPKMDISAFYENGQRFVFYTNVKHDGLDKPPYTEYQRRQDLSNAELMQEALAGLPTQDRDPLDPGTMRGVIEQIYEREQLWRVNRGGYTEEEILNTLKSAGEAVTQDTIEASRSAMNEALAEDLDEMLRERFLESTDMPAARWEEVEDRFFAIHPLTSADTLVGQLVKLYPDDDEKIERRLEKQAKQQLTDTSPMAVFEALASETPKREQLEELGRATEPVQAVFYAAPPWEEDEDEDWND